MANSIERCFEKVLILDCNLRWGGLQSGQWDCNLGRGRGGGGALEAEKGDCNLALELKSGSSVCFIL